MTIDDALKEIRRYAKSGLDTVYSEVSQRIRTNPNATPMFEGASLNKLYIMLQGEARKLIMKALGEIGFKYPTLIWEDTIMPHMNTPKFECLKVTNLHTDTNFRHNDEDYIEESYPRKTSDSFTKTGTVAAVASASAGLVLKLAGAALKASAVSGAGTVFFVGAAVIGACVVYGEFSKKPSDFPGKISKSSAMIQPSHVQQVNVSEIIDNQKRKNGVVMYSWIDDLEKYTRSAIRNAGNT